MSGRALGVWLLLGSLLGCGARSGLELTAPDGGGVDAGQPECLRDGDCDDGLACTVDTCAARRCVHRGDDARCDDGLFCTGPGRCDVALGCVFEVDPCDDRVECTEDTCDEPARACVPLPQAGRCPLSHRCDVERGCVARALAHDVEGNLYEIDLPSGEERFIADTRLRLTDIALHPDGQTYALSSSSLFRVDEATGNATWIGDLEAQVALDVHPDGALVSAGFERVYRVNPDTAAASAIGRFPGSYVASGDIAFVRGRMLITGTNAPGVFSVPDVLFEVPGDGAELVAVGDVGFGCVWGLAPFGDTLYGFDCNGQLLEIDPDTGAGRRLATLGRRRFGGAAAR